MEFTQREFQIIHDKEFLLAKSRAISKVGELLTETRSELKDVCKESILKTNPEFNFKTEKISKGENYRGLPYLLLDYPAIFSAENIFAFRTMFWWGNFFSCTLHLQGNSLDLYRAKIIENISILEESNYFMCIGDSPWEYHFEDDNYRLLSRNDLSFIKACSFLKLSKRIELREWRSLPVIATQTLVHLLNMIKPFA